MLEAGVQGIEDGPVPETLAVKDGRLQRDLAEPAQQCADGYRDDGLEPEAGHERYQQGSAQDDAHVVHRGRERGNEEPVE